MLNYCKRIYKFGNISISCFCYSLCLLDRIITKISIEDTSIHRIVLILIILSYKMLEDRDKSVTEWCKIGGILKICFKDLESQTLKLLDFRLHVTVEEYEKKFTEVVSYNKL